MQESDPYSRSMLLVFRICQEIFDGTSATTKKSKMKVVSGDQLRFVTYPHPKSTMEDTSKQIRHYGDSDACIERLVMSIPNQVRLYCTCWWYSWCNFGVLVEAYTFMDHFDG